ncbi:MAG: extracellular solute-binding protein [Treponema sp.]|nr:extracellular solute-binding protein [Treponema sp.]
MEKWQKKLLWVPLLILAAFPLAAAGGQAGGGGTASPSMGSGKITYPMDTPVTLTYWVELNANVADKFVNLGDTPFARELEKRTGVKVEYLHPPAGGAVEQFNLLIASGELPDLMDRNWVNDYSGGPERAIADGVILKLNDLLPQYAPNFTEYLRANPRFDRMVKTDDRSYYAFPFLRGDDRLCLWQGLLVRKDWLDELGLSIPETFDEWHTVLTAFKEKKGSPAPLTFVSQNGAFIYGYKIDRDFYLGEDGKVHWGSIEEAYRDYLTMMARWYKEGLFDPDFATITSNQITAKITGGVSGATHAGLGGSLGTWTTSARTRDPKFAMTGAPVPVAKKGDKPVIQNIDNPYQGQSTVITGSCKNVELAVRYLDWGYSQDGFWYYNYGTPGVSYNMVNNYPTLTPLILKNPDGLTAGQALASYTRANYNGPFVQDWAYYEQYLILPEQHQAIANWQLEEPYKYKLPPIQPNASESREYASIMSEVNTYRDEMAVKFILGTENLSSWTTYVNTLKRMRIDRAIAIQEAALARYNAR